MSVIIRHFNHFGAIGASMWAQLDSVVRETAAIIRDDAAGHAPVDTGALRESLYVANNFGSGYTYSAAAATSLRHEGNRPGSPSVLVPQVAVGREHQALVVSAVEHALYNEFGTTRMAARPFLVPATEAAASEYFRKIQNVLDGERANEFDAEAPDVAAGVGGAAGEAGVAEEIVPLAIAAL